MFVTGRLILVAVVGVVPVVLSSWAGVDTWAAVIGWMLLCAALATIDAVAATSPRILEVTRRLPARVLLDEPVTAGLVVRSTGRRLRGVLRDGWQPTAGAGAARAPLDIPAGEAHLIEMPLRPSRRGELRTAFVAVRSVGPLGVAGRQARLDVPGHVRVLPPFRSRRHLPSRLARLRELDGNTSIQMRGQGTEFDSLREYVRGDDVRSIDWRATARAGTTMLRTWRPERDRHVVIVVDTGRTSAARVGDGARLDAGMEAALLLSALAQRAGDHVHLVMFDRAVRARVTGLDGPGLLPALVDAMAPVEPTLIDTDWDAAFAQVRRLSVRPALVVILTAHDEPDASRGFLGSLPAVAERSRVIVATAADDLPDPAAPTDADDVYAAAARERSRSDAARVAAAVERAGASAVTASADILPPLVADRYLALKAAGRL